MNPRSILFSAALAVLPMMSHGAWAQMPAARPAAPPTSAQQAALIDLTGYWVAVVDQDWAWRMITPPKNNFQGGVRLNAEGRRIANEFNPALYGGADYQVSGIIDCRAYGAGGLMRMPTRLHITWDNPNALKIETDWGEQTRLLHFIPNQPYEDAQLPLMIQAQAGGMNHGPPSLQGYSVAVWEQPYEFSSQSFSRGPANPPGGGLGGAVPTNRQPGGSLAVVTTDLAPGWLRRNGAPYGAQARMIEHYQTFQDPTGANWFDVTTELIDEQYLAGPDFTSADFMQEPDGSKWAPHPCKQVARD